MDLEHFPPEILINIISRSSNAALRQLKAVSRRLGPLARRRCYESNVLILRGTERLLGFFGHITNNPASLLRMFCHLRFEDYTTFAHNFDICRIIVSVPSLQALYFYRVNVTQALPRTAVLLEFPFFYGERQEGYPNIGLQSGAIS